MIDGIRINAVLSLFMAACLVPMSVVFYGLYWAGRVLTKPEYRTSLGNWLARFCFGVAIFMTAICVLTLNRWFDLKPDMGSVILATICRFVGVTALLWSLLSAHFVFPLLLQRLREGRL